MTLLLGPPASGKSTLLQALAGTLRPGRHLQACLAPRACRTQSAAALRQLSWWHERATKTT
jgi:ABC-type cobalamin/Fe3+-siderophores transport system ATPase subunit